MSNARFPPIADIPGNRDRMHWGARQRMSLFEFTFALSAVILGLALTQIAASLHKLLLAGRRVSWAAEPILLASIVMLVIISVWIGAWFDRDDTSVSIGWIILQVLKLLTLYIAAASCLPEPACDTTPVHTYDYYDRTRVLSFGALIVSYVLFEVADVVVGDIPEQTFSALIEWFLFPLLYALLIFIRARWFNIATLAFVLAFFGYSVLGIRISSGS